ncbi:MAG: hypothetical protein IT562_05070 [Alphaproteobacteria bacterium]|nr:hypothetical protein [Alphaproteobacteria bacterium]
MMMDQAPSILPINPAASEARRRFLAACGSAAAMPPAISLMLGGERNYATATSAGSVARLGRFPGRPLDRHPPIA